MRKKAIVGTPAVDSGLKVRKKTGKAKQERPLCAHLGCQNRVKALQNRYCSTACHGASMRGNATRDPDSVQRGIETKRRNRELALSEA